jgi:hypothetical protein
MIALNSGCKYIVTLDWLIKSVAAKKVLDESLYTQTNKESKGFQKLKGFKLSETLAKERPGQYLA